MMSIRTESYRLMALSAVELSGMEARRELLMSLVKLSGQIAFTFLYVTTCAVGFDFLRGRWQNTGK
jgi:hypothetical protein